MKERKKSEKITQYNDGKLTHENFKKLAISAYLFIIVELIAGIFLVYYFGETWWLYIGLTVLGSGGFLFDDVLFCTYEGYKRKMKAREKENKEENDNRG